MDDFRGGVRAIVGFFDLAIGQRRPTLLALHHLLTIDHEQAPFLLPAATRRERIGFMPRGRFAEAQKHRPATGEGTRLVPHAFSSQKSIEKIQV